MGHRRGPATTPPGRLTPPHSPERRAEENPLTESGRLPRDRGGDDDAGAADRRVPARTAPRPTGHARSGARLADPTTPWAVHPGAHAAQERVA